MASTEQALMVMLRQLPIPITIIWHNGRYHWQCAEGNGSSLDLVGAAEQSLRYLIGLLATDAVRMSDNSKVPAF